MKTSIELSKSLSEIRSLRFTARGGPALAGVPSPGEAANKKNPPEMVDFFIGLKDENQDFGSERIVGENEC